MKMVSSKNLLQGGLRKLRILSAGILIFAWWSISALHTGLAVLRDLHSLSSPKAGTAHRVHSFMRRHGLLMGPLESHVRVVVRAHPKDADLIKSLVWSLRSQGDKLSAVQVDFTFVPTEPGCRGPLGDIVDALEDGRADVKVLDQLDDDWFKHAKEETPLQFRCSRNDVSEYSGVGMDKVRKICDYDNYVYYKATDAALEDTLRTCGSCTHLLVTNGDNSYAPSFLQDTLAQDKDLVITDFAHEREPVEGGTGKGQVDLGGVLFKKSVLLRGPLSFLKALPEWARALEVHDADYWFVQTAIAEGGASYSILHKLLFYHH